MFKFIAIILLFASCTIIGFYNAYRLSMRRHLLQQYRHLVQRMETEMGYFKEPVPQLLAKLQSGTDDPADIMLRQCLIQIEKGTENIARIWTDSVKQAYENEPLKAEDLRLFERCGDFIGQSGFDSQKGHFDLLKNQLDVQIRDADNEVRIKGSLYSKAGLSAGAVLAIALL